MTQKEISINGLSFLLTQCPTLSQKEIMRCLSQAGRESVGAYFVGGLMEPGNWILESLRERKKGPSLWWIAALIMLWLAAAFVLATSSFAFETEASWYSVASCIKEGTSGIMANGRPLNDNEFVCASWDYKFGTVLLVTNVENGKTVRVVCSDRGPSKRLYRMGRRLDLSKAAFGRIANLKQGVINVTVEAL